MREFRSGALLVRACGGADRQGGGEGPAVILCHGFGAPGDDLVSLARVIDAGPSVRWFFPEAPLEVEGSYGGRAWWHIDMLRIQMAIASGRARDFPVDEEPVGLAEARAALTGCIEGLVADHGVDARRLVIGGFSQGAMLTTDLALSAGGAAGGHAGLIVMSGALIAANRWRQSLATMKAAGVSLDVVQSHGRSDQILPFGVGDQLREMLVAGGAKVDFVAHGGGHEIPHSVIEKAGAFLKARFAKA